MREHRPRHAAGRARGPAGPAQVTAIGPPFDPVAPFIGAGEKMYTECEGCHSLKDNKLGPRHCGLIGRKAGSVSDYPSYSHAMRESGLTWDVKTLSDFLAEPFSYLPETGMGYIGIFDQQSRLDLIAYLDKQGKDPSVCPPQ